MDEVARQLDARDISYDYLDLRDYTLPFCDGRAFADYLDEFPDMARISQLMQQADGYIFGYPNYVWTFSGVFKNFLDLFGKYTADKYFGIVVNAGGRNGFMASNDLISIMAFDFSALAIMPQVYTAKDDFHQVGDEWLLSADKPLQKVEQMVDALLFRIQTTVLPQL